MEFNKFLAEMCQAACSQDREQMVQILRKMNRNYFYSFYNWMTNELPNSDIDLDTKLKICSELSIIQKSDKRVPFLATVFDKIIESVYGKNISRSNELALADKRIQGLLIDFIKEYPSSFTNVANRDIWKIPGIEAVLDDDELVANNFRTKLHFFSNTT